MPAITSDDFNRIIAADLPWAREQGMRCDRIGRGEAVVRLPFSESML